MPNALTLDKCCYRIKNGSWSEEMDVWQAQKRIRDILGMKQVFYNGVPQRYTWVKEPHPMDGTEVQFKFTFNVEDVNTKDIYLVVENLENYVFEFNGQKLDNKPCGWYMDKSFKKIELTGKVKGINEIIILSSYKNETEFEDCYIIGDFGVDINRNIVKEPEGLHFGDWCLQGYLHYCGSIIYNFDLEYSNADSKKVMLELGEYSAVTVEIRVNDKTAGHIPWKSANSVDITEYLIKGNNKIDIEVMGSPRNLFGPFHQLDTKKTRIDWSDFRTENKLYSKEYIVKPYGLTGQVNIYNV